MARFVGAMGVAIGPDDVPLVFARVGSLTEAGAENPVLVAMFGA